MTVLTKESAISLWFRGLRRITTTGKFIPEIDGFRFIAVLAVFLHHDLNQIMAKNNIARVPGSKLVNINALSGFDWLLSVIVDRGAFGVQLFFVISGFILAMPFAEHYINKEKRPSLKAYFLRRLTRLEPPYILALILWIPFAGGHAYYFDNRPLSVLPGSFVASVFYVHNQVYHSFSYINGVSWSLEVEVQFYILAPLLAGAFVFNNVWVRRLLLIAVIGITSYMNAYYSPDHLGYQYSILYYIQYFLSGFILADVYLTYVKKHPRKSYLWDVAALIAGIFIVTTVVNRWPHTFMPWSIAFFYLAGFKSILFNRFLRWPPVWAIGGMCYSIYLLHAHMVSILAFLTKIMYISMLPFWVNFLIQTAIHGAIVLFISSMFFKLIERPCMDRDWPRKLANSLRKRFSTPDRSLKST